MAPIGGSWSNLTLALLALLFLVLTLGFDVSMFKTVSPQPGRLRFRVRREGWLWLLLAGNLFLIGWGRGINLVVPLAYLMLLAVVLNALLAPWGLRRLAVRRRIEGPVFAAVPFTLDLEVHNPRRRALLGVRVDDRGPDHEVSDFLVRLAGGATVCRRHTRTLHRRGRYRWGPLTVANGSPFGLAEWYVHCLPPEEIIVLPRLGRLHRGRLHRFLTQDTPLEEQFRPSGRPSPTARSEVHGLRPLRSGDSPRWIHWRTSARRGELMVREFESIRGNDLLLVLVPPTHPGLLEEAVSLTATLCWEWCRQRSGRLGLAVAGAAPVLWKGGAGPDLARQMLEGLAVLEPPAAVPLPPLLAVLRSAEVPAGPVLGIGAESTPRAALAAGLRRPVAWLDVSRLDRCDFYEGPAGDAP